MSSKSQNWLTGDRGKTLVFELPLLSFFLLIFIVGTTNNNQLPMSTSTIINGRIDRNTRMNEGDKHKRGKIESIWGITN